MFGEEVYGIIPKWHGKFDVTPVSRKENIFDGMVTREEVMHHIKNGNKQIDVLLLVYIYTTFIQTCTFFLEYNFFNFVELRNSRILI